MRTRRLHDTQELPIVSDAYATAEFMGVLIETTVGGEFEGAPAPGDNYSQRCHRAACVPVYADLGVTQELPAFEG